MQNCVVGQNHRRGPPPHLTRVAQPSQPAPTCGPETSAALPRMRTLSLSLTLQDPLPRSAHLCASLPFLPLTHGDLLSGPSPSSSPNRSMCQQNSMDSAWPLHKTRSYPHLRTHLGFSGPYKSTPLRRLPRIRVSPRGQQLRATIVERRTRG